jgi:hypothetical protein
MVVEEGEKKMMVINVQWRDGLKIRPVHSGRPPVCDIQVKTGWRDPYAGRSFRDDDIWAFPTPHRGASRDDIH